MKKNTVFQKIELKYNPIKTHYSIENNEIISDTKMPEYFFG